MITKFLLSGRGGGVMARHFQINHAVDRLKIVSSLTLNSLIGYSIDCAF